MEYVERKQVGHLNFLLLPMFCSIKISSEQLKELRKFFTLALYITRSIHNVEMGQNWRPVLNIPWSNESPTGIYFQFELATPVVA